VIDLGSDRPAALEARGLGKRYGRSWALRDLDLELSGPGVIGLVGPNAAGKSTLIRMWMGFERPTRGSVTVLGRDPFRHRRQALADVGYVPQTPTLYDALSVNEHLILAERFRPAFDRAVAADRLARLRIPGDAVARRLSGGQQAQVMLSLAIGTGASVLLLDEPLAHLDPLARSEFLAVVADAAGSGMTVVLSSHIVHDLERVCDQVIVLGLGRVLLHSTVEAALATHVVRRRDRGLRDAIGPIDNSGGVFELARRGPEADASRPATLNEVVLGYLASAREFDVIQ
jgi:ABC-2 type transport system ATP-binding protein